MVDSLEAGALFKTKQGQVSPPLTFTCAEHTSSSDWIQLLLLPIYS